MTTTWSNNLPWMFLPHTTILIFASVFLTSANATNTICPDRDWKRFHYGNKATLFFKTGKSDFNDTEEIFSDFGRASGMNHSGAGPTSNYGRVIPNTLTVLMQSRPSDDVLITIESTKVAGTARATISTFSYSCGATESWRPYWSAFKAYLSTRKLPVVRGSRK